MGGKKGQLYATSLEKKQYTNKENFLGYFSNFTLNLPILGGAIIYLN